jgi:hypothetical protein
MLAARMHSVCQTACPRLRYAAQTTLPCKSILCQCCGAHWSGSQNNTAVFLADVTLFRAAAAPYTSQPKCNSVRLFYIDAARRACQLAVLRLCALALPLACSSACWCRSRGWPAIGIDRLVPAAAAQSTAAAAAAAVAAARDSAAGSQVPQQPRRHCKPAAAASRRRAAATKPPPPRPRRSGAAHEAGVLALQAAHQRRRPPQQSFWTLKPPLWQQLRSRT